MLISTISVIVASIQAHGTDSVGMTETQQIHLISGLIYPFVTLGQRMLLFTEKAFGGSLLLSEATTVVVLLLFVVVVVATSASTTASASASTPEA